MRNQVHTLDSILGNCSIFMFKVEVSELTVEAEDSGGLPRIAGPANDFVKGSINNRPFRPGGLDGSQASDRILPIGASDGEWVWEVINGGCPQAIPPSFKEGMDLGDLKVNLLQLYGQITLNKIFVFTLVELRIFYDAFSFFNFVKARSYSWNVYKDQTKSTSVEKLVSI